MADDPCKSVADIQPARGGGLADLDPRQLARLKALANKRDQGLEMMTETIRKQRGAQQAIINNLR